MPIRQHRPSRRPALQGSDSQTARRVAVTALASAHAFPEYPPAHAIAYFTGSRISEVLQLTVADVTGERVLFRAANTKMRQMRVAMVVPQLQAFLGEYEFPESGYLFPAHHNGSKGGHLSRQGADWMLRQVCAAVELEGVSTHSFRRSFATNLHHNGEPLAKICRLLGHKDLTMTARYIG